MKTRLFPLFLAVALSLCVTLPCSAAPAEKRTALVIGNGDYAAGPLKTPLNDARDLAETLKKLGFSVVFLENADRERMEKAVRDLGANLRFGGVGLFYFAGHGLQIAGENYLVPVGARIESEIEMKPKCLAAGLVLGAMAEARNGLNIVILDACRDNPFARGFPSATSGLARMEAPAGTLIAFSAAPGAVAANGLGRNGVYARSLIENIRQPGLTLEEVFRRVRNGVLQETDRQQNPWVATTLPRAAFSFAGPGSKVGMDGSASIGAGKQAGMNVFMNF